MFVRTFFMTGLWADPERFFPVLLNSRRKLVQARKKCRHLPHVLLAERFIPCGHAAVADAGSDSVKNVPLGIIERLEDKLRRGGLRERARRPGLVVEPAWPPGPVILYQFLPAVKVAVGGGNG